MIDLNNLPEIIEIGRKGENQYRAVEFDGSAWLAENPGASITIVYKRPDNAIYPVVTAATTTPIVWNVSNADTVSSGWGRLEARLIKGTMIGKKGIVKIRVFDSLTGEAPAPTPPAPDWITTAAALQAQIGDLDELETTEKGNLVDAINELAEGGGGGAANAVLYTEQTLTTEQKTQARTNIGAGTSSFDGAYGSLTGKPTIPTKTSELVNDSGFLTAHQSLAAYRTSSAQDTIDNGKQATALTSTVTISVADWSGGTTCTKSVSGVTATNIVFCDSSDTSVQCTAQASGTLTFSADATPTADVTVKVVILP